MEAYLLENEEILKLDNNNFNDVTVLDAEIALKSGRKTSNRDGWIDRSNLCHPYRRNCASHTGLMCATHTD